MKDNSPNVHYIQTFCVHQPHKPLHPYWLVVAANQKMGDKDGKKSMNDLLYTGPNLLKDLTSLIIRTRSAIFMLLADISRFFQRIAMASDDAHYQRFVALRMGKTEKSKKSIPSSAVSPLDSMHRRLLPRKFYARMSQSGSMMTIREKQPNGYMNPPTVMTSYLPEIMKQILFL